MRSYVFLICHSSVQIRSRVYSHDVQSAKQYYRLSGNRACLWRFRASLVHEKQQIDKNIYWRVKGFIYEIDEKVRLKFRSKFG